MLALSAAMAKKPSNPSPRASGASSVGDIEREKERRARVGLEARMAERRRERATGGGSVVSPSGARLHKRVDVFKAQMFGGRTFVKTNKGKSRCYCDCLGDWYDHSLINDDPSVNTAI